jgi:predicted heme/steroid binding protein
VTGKNGLTKNIVLATVASAILGCAMIGGAVLWQLSSSRNGGGNDAITASTNRSFTAEELALYDGKEDNQCLVAVDGDVYLIEGFTLWAMGEHVPSGGQARCGFDLTDVIDESPHGRSKLQLLKNVGTLS